MSKKLIAYFSASGVTKAAAQKLSQAISADVFEIKPKVPYTLTDLNWTDKKSRSSIEMQDPSSRPEIAETISNSDDYDTIFIGFPVWWYAAPTIVNTFIESADFSGKTIVLFCTSGGTGITECEKKFQSTYGGKYLYKNGKRLMGSESIEMLRNWAEKL